MARVIDIKCPKCSAPLPIAADAKVVTCRYCGGTSAIERPGTVVQAPPGQFVVHVPPPTAARRVAVWGLVAASVALGAGVFTVSRNLEPSQPSQPSDLAAVAAQPPGAPVVKGASYDFDDQPMLADVNGDGAPDVVGRVRESKLGAWIAAFDGTSGVELWRSELLTADASGSDTMRGVVHGRVVAIDGLGKVQAYDLKTGGPSWSSLLGEKARAICAGERVIVVETVDELRRGLDPDSGKQRELTRAAACAPVPSSDPDISPGYRVIGWWDLGKHGLPGLHATEGISAHRALVPVGAGTRFLLGSRSKGTSVAMVAAIGDKRERLWMDVVPGVDPLTTSVNVTTQTAAYTEGVLVVPYNMRDSAAGTRMAAFAAVTGTRLWDVLVVAKEQASGGLAITPERVFVRAWNRVEVLSLKTGERQFSIGGS